MYTYRFPITSHLKYLIVLQLFQLYEVLCELWALGKYNFKGIFVRDPSIAVDKIYVSALLIAVWNICLSSCRLNSFVNQIQAMCKSEEQVCEIFSTFELSEDAK